MNQPDRTLLGIFSAEQAEHVQRMRVLIDALAGSPAESAAAGIEELLRRAHTLKGAARAVGLEQTEALTHRLEGVFGRWRETGVPGPDARSAIHRALDFAEDILAAAVAERRQPEGAAIFEALDAFPEGSSANVVPSPESAPPAPVPDPSPLGPSVQFVRVNTNTLDDLIRAASHLLAATAAQNNAEQRIDGLLQRLDETAKEWARLRRQTVPYARQRRDDPDFAPLRDCLAYMDGRLPSLLAEVRVIAATERHKNREMRQRADDLHDDACRVRMTPAEAVFGAFGSMVRELAQQEGKQVEFRAEGLELEADRLVLQALKDPVMHLLRNAVSHGIELEHERLAQAKLPTGLIRLRIQPRGDRLRLIVEDDGRGLDQKRVIDEAVKLGLLTKENSEGQSLEEVTRLIFEPGLSTASVVTNLSGRGMGLSIVQQEVSRLHGDVRVRPRSGGGTRIVLTVPLSISTQHILLLSAGARTFGIPAGFVVDVHRVQASDIRSVNGRECILVESAPVPLARLVDLLELQAAPVNEKEWPRQEQLHVAVLSFGEEQLAVVVDHLLDEREAVIKDLGLPSSDSGLGVGAIPLDDGAVAVMLNVKTLFGRFHRRTARMQPQFLAPRPEKPVFRILVVDDSITTRSLEKSILEAHGYQVRLAVDGLEALEKIRKERPDLVITDVMMPRLNGFQLVEQMKNDKEMAAIPVIMVTSLERREEQERGLSLGVDAYIVKRRFDQRELLATVRQIL